MHLKLPCQPREFDPKCAQPHMTSFFSRVRNKSEAGKGYQLAILGQMCESHNCRQTRNWDVAANSEGEKSTKCHTTMSSPYGFALANLIWDLNSRNILVTWGLFFSQCLIKFKTRVPNLKKKSFLHSDSPSQGLLKQNTAVLSATRPVRPRS